MDYLIVKGISGLTPAYRAKAISKELYSISRPDIIKEEADVSMYLFGVVEHPDGVQAALCVDFDYIIKVHQDNDLNNLIALFGDLSEEEIDALETYIDSEDSFPFRNILTSNAVIKTQGEMDSGGWFPKDDF